LEPQHKTKRWAGAYQTPNQWCSVTPGPAAPYDCYPIPAQYNDGYLYTPNAAAYDHVGGVYYQQVPIDKLVHGQDVFFMHSSFESAFIGL